MADIWREGTCEYQGRSAWKALNSKLFVELRNPSAHSYGDIHFELERKHAIDAQCFAALVLRGYIDKNVKSLEEAMNTLKFNKKFLGRVEEKMSTKSIKKP